MRFSFLCALGGAVFALSIKGQTLQMSDPIPRANDVCAVPLANGVQSIVYENFNPPHWGSFRVVMRKSSHEELLFSYEGSLKEIDSIEQFFKHCAQKAVLSDESSEHNLDSCYYQCSALPGLEEKGVAEMAVIAVGDFSPLEMQKLIESHFSHIGLDGSSDMRESHGIRVMHDPDLQKVALRITHPSINCPIDTYADLQEEWKSFLVQHLFQNRLEKCARFQEEEWVHPHPRFFTPVPGYALTSEEISENLLSFFLWQIETIRKEGFSDEEFYIAKRDMLRNIQYLNASAQDPSNAFLASYFADQFLLGSPFHSHDLFFSASEEFVAALQPSDVAVYVDPFLDQGRQLIEVVYPMHLQKRIMTEEKIGKIVDHVSALASFYPENGFEEEEGFDWEFDENFIKQQLEKCSIEDFERFKGIHPNGFSFAQNLPLRLASHNAPEQSFYKLPLSEKEKKLIKSIITTMAHKNIFQLAFEKRDMEKKGKRINDVHPLRFLGYIFSSSELKSCMRTIKKSSFKWDGFMDGLSRRMRQESSVDNLTAHVPGFAQLVGADPDSVIHHIEKKDWEGLVKSLL